MLCKTQYWWIQLDPEYRNTMGLQNGFEELPWLTDINWWEKKNQYFMSCSFMIWCVFLGGYNLLSAPVASLTVFKEHFQCVTDTF